MGGGVPPFEGRRPDVTNVTQQILDRAASVWYNENMSNTTTDRTLWVSVIDRGADEGPLVLGIHRTEALGQLNCQCDMDVMYDDTGGYTLQWEDHPGVGSLAYTPDGEWTYHVQGMLPDDD
jgi:hypothetical protein